MPPPPKHLRRLKTEFCMYMDRNGSWPSLQSFQRKLVDLGWNKQDVARMKRGEAVAEKYVIALAKILEQPKTETHRDYLRNHAPAKPALSLEAIIELISQPHTGQNPSPQDTTDYFRDPYQKFGELFVQYQAESVLSERMICHSPEDVALGIRMFMSTLGREFREENRLLDEEAHIAVAAQFMRISYDQHVERTVRLWRTNRYCLTFAVLDQTRVGTCIVLPLSEPVFETVRRGKMITFDCGPNDLANPSNTLFIEGIGWTADDGTHSLARKTKQVVRSMVLQFALMSRPVSQINAQPSERFRVITYGGNPPGDVRAHEFGLLPNGHTLDGYGAPILELDPDAGWALISAVGRFQELLRREKTTTDELIEQIAAEEEA